jgi:adenylate kinase
MKKILLLGPPGAGKGTQARLLAERLGLPQVVSGDLLRQAVAEKTPHGLKIQAVLDAGKLVEDPLMLELITAHLNAPSCSTGFILDGFPRTVGQAQNLQNLGVSLDHVLVLKVPDNELIKRLTGRYIHPSSGRVYNIVSNPPKKAGVDDLTGEPLVQRNDDAPDTVAERLNIYHEVTEQLIAWYQEAVKQHLVGKISIVNGQGSVEHVLNQLLAYLVDT